MCPAPYRGVLGAGALGPWLGRLCKTAAPLSSRSVRFRVEIGRNSRRDRSGAAAECLPGAAVMREGGAPARLLRALVLGPLRLR